MPFFDQSYIEDLLSRAERGLLPKLARPAFRLCTQPGWKTLRDEIDRFFARLDDSPQTRLRRKRNDLENISQTVNEMKVGMHLLAEGYAIEYEKPIGGLTPDWCVTKPEGGSFVVEVLSKRDSDEKNLEQEFLSDLRDLCKNMDVGVVLAFRLFMKSTPIEWSDQLVNEIAKELSVWLKTRPLPRALIEIQGVEVELVRYSEKLKHVELLPFTGAFWVNSFPLGQRISEKAVKYEALCLKYSFPFVTACCTSFSTAIEEDEFAEICPGLFSSNHCLTSVWAFIEGKVRVFNNPAAAFALTESNLIFQS